MGACFCYRTLPVFELTEQRKAIASQMMLAHYNEQVELGDIEEEELPDMLKVLDDYPTFRERRDTGFLRVGDHLWLITGGMIYGDAPTQSYEDFSKLSDVEDLLILMEKWSEEDARDSKPGCR